MRYLMFFLLVLTFSCSKQKSVLICGDHICINKIEAKQYFEENLTIEVQIISKNKKSSYDLVDLNTNENKQDIKIFKNKNNKIVKKLSKEEIRIKKTEIKKKKKIIKNNNKDILKIKTKNSEALTAYDNKNSIDICLKLDKCDIDSITDYLIKVSNEKDYPNISLKN